MIHTLKLLKNDNNKRKIYVCDKEESDYTIEDLYIAIIRPLPIGQIYKDRLEHEINMIESKNLIGYIMVVLEILND